MPQDDEENVTFRRSSGNVFADLGLENADELLVKADLAHAINEEIRARGLTQAEAGRLGGLTQPQVSNIARMKLDDFSQERLQTVLRRLGVDVEIKLHRRADGGIGTLKVYA
jgi:predicted XRE-type DNA-binding protein